MVMASLAMELKDQGIKFALLCPGWVNTRMGGEKAPITPEVSVTGLRNVIDNLSIEQSGKFYRYNGESIPW
jgi:short-subunit dehydrogenase